MSGGEHMNLFKRSVNKTSVEDTAVPYYEGNIEEFKEKVSDLSSEELWNLVNGKYNKRIVTSTLCLEILAERNDLEAQLELVNRYCADYGSIEKLGILNASESISDIDPDGNKTVKYLKMACRNGDTESMYYLGKLYQDASMYLRFHTETKELELCKDVASSQHYKGLEQDFDAYLICMTCAAQQGYGPACDELGTLYADYFLGHYHKQKALTWLRTGAAYGNMHARLTLAKFMEQDAYTNDATYGEFILQLQSLLDGNPSQDIITEVKSLAENVNEARRVNNRTVKELVIKEPVVEGSVTEGE